jgi:hypothetical protein
LSEARQLQEIHLMPPEILDIQDFTHLLLDIPEITILLLIIEAQIVILEVEKLHLPRIIVLHIAGAIFHHTIARRTTAVLLHLADPVTLHSADPVLEDIIALQLHFQADILVEDEDKILGSLFCIVIRLPFLCKKIKVYNKKI